MQDLKKHRFGIDLGGTKIELIVLVVEEVQGQIISSDILFRERVATPKEDYQGTVKAILGLIHQAEQTLSISADSIGVGIPGAISYKTGLIKNANSQCLIGQDLKGDLQALLKAPVSLANDANCFALSEAKDGAAKEGKIVFGVIIGTGCGGGLVVDGHIVSGVNAIGGEWGHNPLPWQAKDDTAMSCYCGLKGCNETFLSGSGFQAHFYELTGQKLRAQEIVALAEQGDEQAQQMLDRYVLWLAKGLASVINIVDPDVIVLGGGMSNIEMLYERVPEIWQRWVFSDQVDTKLVAPEYGDSSGVRGAAWL